MEKLLSYLSRICKKWFIFYNGELKEHKIEGVSVFCLPFSI